MTQKEKCTGHCLDLLNSRNAGHAFNPKILDSYYLKFNGGSGNAFVIGMKVADMMIEQYKPTAPGAQENNQYI